MGISEEVKFERFLAMRNNRRCECVEKIHGHSGRCKNPVDYPNRGRGGPGSWEAHLIIPLEKGGAETVDNCRIYCWPCHEKSLK